MELRRAVPAGCRAGQRPRELGLERDDAHGIAGRIGVADQPQHALDVVAVLRAQRARPGIVAGVVIGLAQAELAGAELRRGAVDVIGIGVGVEREHQRTDPRVELGEHAGELRGVAERVDRREQIADRRGAARLDRGGVEAGRVVAADPRGRGVATAGVAGGGLDDRALALEVQRLDLGIAAPSRAIGRDRMGAPPAATRVVVEVVARIARGVDRGDVEPQRRVRGRRGGRSRGRAQRSPRPARHASEGP